MTHADIVTGACDPACDPACGFIVSARTIEMASEHLVHHLRFAHTTNTITVEGFWNEPAPSAPDA